MSDNIPEDLSPAQLREMLGLVFERRRQMHERDAETSRKIGDELLEVMMKAAGADQSHAQLVELAERARRSTPSSARIQFYLLTIYGVINAMAADSNAGRREMRRKHIVDGIAGVLENVAELNTRIERNDRLVAIMLRDFIQVRQS